MHIKITRFLQLGIMAISVALAGCAAPHLPQGARFVGGGLMVEYQAPTDGTAILIERASGRIVASKSLSERDYFEFGPNHLGCREVVFSMFADTNSADSEAFAPVPTNTFFELYFVSK
jgi:hypothetical protein